MPEFKPVLPRPVAEHLEAPPPEDVATLYSWANLHGAKYRDFSSSRAAAREEARQRAEEAKAEERRRLEAEEELKRQEAAQIAAREAAEAAEAARQVEAERLAAIARQAEAERQAVLAAQEAQREAALQRSWKPEGLERGAGEQKGRTPSLEPFFAAVLSGQEQFSPQPRGAARANVENGLERGEDLNWDGVAVELRDGNAARGPHDFPADPRAGAGGQRTGQGSSGQGWPRQPLGAARQENQIYRATEDAGVRATEGLSQDHGAAGRRRGAVEKREPASYSEPERYPAQDPFGGMLWAEPGEGTEEVREPVSRPAWLSGEAGGPRAGSPDVQPDWSAGAAIDGGSRRPVMQPYSTRPVAQSTAWELEQRSNDQRAMERGRVQLPVQNEPTHPARQLASWAAAQFPGPHPGELHSRANVVGGLTERGPRDQVAAERIASGWNTGAGAQEAGGSGAVRQVPMYQQGFPQRTQAQPAEPVVPSSQPLQSSPGGTMMGNGMGTPVGRDARTGVEDTLEGSRDRIASRWYALKTVFDPQAKAEPAPVQLLAKVPVLAVFSLAGGVGKTSLVASLGRALSSRGERTLLVDTAPYGLLPFFFGARDQRPGMLRTFNPPGASAEAPVRLVTLDPDGPLPEPELDGQGSGQMSGMRMHDPGSDWLPSEIKRLSRGTHRVMVDLPTASGATTRRILKLGPVVVVPVAPDMNSVVSVGAIEAFFRTQNLGLPQGSMPVLPFYILNQFDYAMPLHIDVREVLRGQIGDRLLPFALRRSAAISEALAEGMTVIDYAPNADVAEDYAHLAEWVRGLAAPATESYRGVRWSER